MPSDYADAIDQRSREELVNFLTSDDDGGLNLSSFLASGANSHHFHHQQHTPTLSNGSMYPLAAVDGLHFQHLHQHPQQQHHSHQQHPHMIPTHQRALYESADIVPPASVDTNQSTNYSNNSSVVAVSQLEGSPTSLSMPQHHPTPHQLLNSQQGGGLSSMQEEFGLLDGISIDQHEQDALAHMEWFDSLLHSDGGMASQAFMSVPPTRSSASAAVGTPMDAFV